MPSASLVIRALMALVVALYLAGCVQTKTTPGYARAGDHIIIGLGGVNRNAGGESVLTESDLNIVLTDANSVQHTLQARFIFKGYLDYDAQMSTFAIDGTTTQYGLNGMVPFDGGWNVVSPLTYPNDFGNPLPLAVGPATISVTSPKLINTNDNLEGDQTSIPIEILPGTSPQDVDFVRQFTGYVATPRRFFIQPDDLTGITEVGGAFLVIDYIDDSFFLNGLEPMVVQANPNPFAQLSYNVVPNGNGTGTIYVTVLNPNGFKIGAIADTNSSLLSDLTVKLVYFAAVAATPAQAKANFSLDAASSYYIGMDGVALPGLTPTLVHVADL